MVFGSGEAE